MTTARATGFLRPCPALRRGLGLGLGLALGLSSPLASATGEASPTESVTASQGPAQTTSTPPPPRIPPPRILPAREPWQRTWGTVALSGGLTLFGVTYLVSAITGMIVYDVGIARQAEPRRVDEGLRLETLGRRMLIPGVGPWMAIPLMEDAENRAFSAVAGGFQILGIGLAIFGGVELGISRRLSPAGAPTVARIVRSRSRSRGPGRWTLHGHGGRTSAGATAVFSF